MKRIHGAFINARYSTDNQNPDSIEVQVEKCTAWCNQNSVPILGVFADEAVSGMKDTRPQYAAMVDQLRMGLADMVVIYDQSRMFRKMTAWFAFRDEMASLGVRVVCVTQPTIGKDLRDPTNFVTEGSMALFNQMHALITRQKVMEKMRFMARNGQYTGGKPALGYQIENGSLVICEAEAAIVRRIFSEYASGLSYREILAGLNRDGLKTKRGNTFGNNSLHDLLKNEKYIGVLVYGASPYREDGTRNTHAKDGADVIRIEGAVPKIVEKELFDAVQERMAQNKRQQGGRPPTKREYPLKGKVFCADCKSAMNISISKGNYFYYKCSAQKRTHQCQAKPISADVLETAVAETVRKILGDPVQVGHLISILRDQAEKIQGAAVSTLQSLITERGEIQKKLDNAADAILAGLSSKTILERIADLERQRDLIDAQVRSLKASVDATAIPEVTLRKNLDYILGVDSHEVNALLAIVCRVEVSEDSIDVWTILDTDPNGNFDFDQDGVIITPGTGFAVPIKKRGQCPLFFYWFRMGLERSNRNMPVAAIISALRAEMQTSPFYGNSNAHPNSVSHLLFSLLCFTGLHSGFSFGIQIL